MNTATRVRTYMLTKSASDLTFEQWKSLGGCGLPHMETAFLCAELKIPPRKLDDLTLGAIAAKSNAAGRMLARFAYEQMDGGQQLSIPVE